MAAINKVKVAISSDFMGAFAAIPKNMQGKILEFVARFKNDPTASSINYEKITQFKDSTLRSVRIDKAYRGIVKKPETGNVYMLLWVDHHDKAYAWAKNKKCSINPETGSVQVYDVTESQTAKEDDTQSHKNYQDSFFASIHDRHLLKLGVPEDQLPLVRNIYSDEQFDKVAPQLPAEANEALTALCSRIYAG